MVHMFGWLKRWLLTRKSLAPAPPASQRSKTYQAESGYVYQYVFEGRHCCGRETAFIFTVTAQRQTPQRVAIVVPDSALAPFEKEAGRRLVENERYGVAKLALFRLFDASEKPDKVWKGTQVDATRAREYLQILDV
jgi:hypothetical protein